MRRFGWIVSNGITAVAATVVAGIFSFAHIASDVSSRTAGTLKGQGGDWAAVAIDGRDVTLSGMAPTPEARQKAVATATEVYGVRVVADETTVLPLAAPFVTSIERTPEGTLVVSGAAPGAAARDALLKKIAAAFPGVTVVDRLTEARGAAADWAARMDFVLARAAGLKRGSVAFTADDLAISGDPVDYPTWVGIEKALAEALPKGTRVASDTLTIPRPDPYRLTLKAKGGSAALEGFVPDAGARDRLVAAVKARFGGVEDRLAIAPGAPQGFVETILALLPNLARFGDVSFDLSGAAITLSGSSVTAALGDQIVAKIRSLLPAGFVLVDAAVAALPPPPQVAAAECQSELAAVQTGEKILFDTGKATLDDDGTRVLDALVATALRCLDARVSVEGHTDAEGDAEANQTLSQARAKAVVDYLVAGGIAPERLEAVGYGASRPVADNATAEGRQQNRRIEFRVE